MEKYANVKSIENLIEMGDDAVIDFVNNIWDMIKNHEIRIDDVKSRYGFNITDAKLYLASKYATKNGNRELNPLCACAGMNNLPCTPPAV